jgi:hypothetical protein
MNNLHPFYLLNIPFHYFCVSSWQAGCPRSIVSVTISTIFGKTVTFHPTKLCLVLVIDWQRVVQERGNVSGLGRPR